MLIPCLFPSMSFRAHLVCLLCLANSTVFYYSGSTVGISPSVLFNCSIAFSSSSLLGAISPRYVVLLLLHFAQLRVLCPKTSQMLQNVSNPSYDLLFMISYVDGFLDWSF